MIKRYVECDLCKTDGIPIPKAYLEMTITVQWRNEHHLMSESVKIGDACETCFTSVKDFMYSFNDSKEDEALELGEPDILSPDPDDEYENGRNIGRPVPGYAGDPC